MIDERRRFERVNLPETSKVYVADTQKRTLGPVVMIGRGGMLFRTDFPFEEGSRVDLLLVDDSEGIKRELNAIVRYNRDEGVGIEFWALSRLSVGLSSHGRHSSDSAGHSPCVESVWRRICFARIQCFPVHFESSSSDSCSESEAC